MLHAFKNIKAGFITHEFFQIPEAFVEKYNLPSNNAKSAHLKDILQKDENCNLKLAPKLREEYLDKSNHFFKDPR